MQSISVRSEQDRQEMIKASTDIRLWPDEEVELLGTILAVWRVTKQDKAAWGSLLNRVANELVRRERNR